MTAFVVGARSGDPERARFIRALLASLLLHGVLFVLKVGPVSGVHAPSLPGGGTIEAVLRRAPAPAAVPEQPVDATLQPALATMTADAHTQPDQPKPVEMVARPAAAPPTTTTEAPGHREEGRDVNAGATVSGSESQAIPLLPPLPVTAREIPRRPSLLAPMNFSYPPNVRVLGGRVRVRIHLDEKGRVEEMRVVAAVPQGFFDHAAVEVLRKGRFAPGF
ncbi:MAG: TonB family protein, partial [Betaproteobacteria bacterium]|nr:TonB family protein [Betaproteobacteria bacterium]